MALRDWLFQTKKAKIPFISNSEQQTLDSYSGGSAYLTPYLFRDDPFVPIWGNLVNQLYSANSAIGQCMYKLATGFPEPPVVVSIGDEPRPDHPLQALLNRPNPQMSHAEMMALTIIYRAVGGNCYIHKVRLDGVVRELWPLHQGQMWAVPSQYGWVEEFEYKDGDGQKHRVPSRDVIHLKWPLPDMRAPYLGMSPLEVIALEVMTDSEASRFVRALLKNDAIPRGVVTLPEGTAMSPKKAEDLRDKFKHDHGGDNRGGIVILEQGAGYTRVSMNPDELAFDALRRVPEARIAGNLGVPPVVAGLNVGIERSTYTNYPEARKQMSQETFVPMWRMDGVELTQALQNEFPGYPTVGYNTSLVASLQESTNEKIKRSVPIFEKNGCVLDEFREMIDLPPIDQVIPGDTRGKLFSYELKPAPTLQPRTIDAIVNTPPPQLTQEDA